MIEVRDVIILHEAAEDLEAGREFYEDREFGVGQYFIDCLLSDLESLKFQAGIHRKEFGFYRVFSKRFPFAIYYDISEDFARVAAILDVRRNPAWIRSEIEERKS